MPRGGKRPGAGRKPGEFRQMMQAIASDPEAVQNAWNHAKTDPVFWLKCCEFGHGRPPQALKVTGPDDGPLEHIVRFPASGLPGPFADGDSPVPTPGADERSEG